MIPHPLDPLTILGILVAIGATLAMIGAIGMNWVLPPDPKQELYIGKETHYVAGPRRGTRPTTPPPPPPPPQRKDSNKRAVRCDWCMSVFPEEMIDVDALGPNSGETCPVCMKGGALMDIERGHTYSRAKKRAGYIYKWQAPEGYVP